MFYHDIQCVIYFSIDRGKAKTLYQSSRNIKSKFMMTLEKLLKELKPESLNEIIAGGSIPGGSADGIGTKPDSSVRSGRNRRSDKSDRSAKSRDQKINKCGSH